MTSTCKHARAGFSLVEVCLAVIVVGLGLMVIFGLFPVGLAASEASRKDTETGLFASVVLDGLQAQVMDLENFDWTDWKENKFSVESPDGDPILLGKAAKTGDMAYYLDVEVSSNLVKQVSLYALPSYSGPVPAEGAIRTFGNLFYTELLFTELPE